MSQHYSDPDPDRESNPFALPDVEVFYVDETDASVFVDDDDQFTGTGWYYWFCFPGCLPDSGPIGPFATEAEALADAQETNE